MATLHTGESAATGIVYDDSGHVLTAWHVIAGAVSISVRKADGSVTRATTLGAVPSSDIALLILEDSESLDPVDFADMADVRIGDDVVAIGYALGLEGGPTVSKGIVSALGRTLPGPSGDPLPGLVQTDAAISPGSSGGPLVDVHGRVIGMNTVRLNLGEGVGFAIDAETIVDTVGTLIDQGPSTPGYIGIATQDVSSEYLSSQGLPASPAMLIEAVGSETPAETAGLMIGDVILSIDGQSVTNRAQLEIFLSENLPGSEITMFLWRLDSQSDWRPIQVNVTLGPRPDASAE